MAKRETFTNPPDADGASFSGWDNSGFAAWVYSVDPSNPDEAIHLLNTVKVSSMAYCEPGHLCQF